MSTQPRTAYYQTLPGRFAETQWTTIIRPSGEGNLEALDLLARAYWHPLHSFARRQGASESEAEDQVQEFLVKLCEPGKLASADPAKGKFRSFLLRMFRNFLVSRWRRTRNAPEQTSLDHLVEERGDVAMPAAEDSRDADFYRDWAITLLNLALQRLAEDQEALGRGSVFAHLRHHLAGGRDLAALSGQLGIPVNTLKSDLRRLRQRLRRLLAEEVRRTLDHPTPAEVEEELAFIHRYVTSEP